MSRYDEYRHLLGRKYVDGKQDCYGLMINYYKDLHGITLRNFARPNQFWHRKDFDLINDMVGEDKWKMVGLNVKNLQIGDSMFFAIGSATVNHLGIYVGNGMLLHHLHGRFSNVESLTGSWTSRLLMIIRHQELKLEPEKIDILTQLPNHVKRTLRIDS